MQTRLTYRLIRAESLAGGDAERNNALADAASARATQALLDALGNPTSRELADLYRRLELRVATGPEMATILEVERSHAADWKAAGSSPRDFLAAMARIRAEFCLD